MAKVSTYPAATPSHDDLLYFIQNPLGTPLSRTVAVQEASGGVFNVKQYGAVGNGVTDDTNAIKDTIVAMLIAGGGSLYFPAGTYKITSTILFDLTAITTYGFNVYGDGSRSVIYYTAIDGTDCFHFLGGVADTATLHIHDLQLLGPNNAGSGHGIRLQRCIMPALLDSLVIWKFGGGSGIYVESSWLTNIQNVWSQLNMYGALLTNDPIPGAYGSTVNTTIQNSHLQGNTSHGLYVPDIGGGYTIGHVTVDNCIIEGNGGGGIVAYGVQNLILRNIYFETNDSVIGDVDLHKCIFGKIECCGSHFAVGPYQSLTLDNVCGYIALACNNWQGSVTYDSHRIYDLFSTWDTATGVWHEHQTYNTDAVFVANDTSPSVKNAEATKFWYTANTVPTTINHFDDGFQGQEIVVLVNDAVTTIDFTGTFLKGNNGADYAATNGDVIRAIKMGNYWYCQIIK